jgi:osmotically inducible lipoprotein OsmB
MKHNMTICCALAATLALAGCESMSDTQRRTGTGAAIGGAAAGVVTGEWGWAAAGAAVGAASGYLYDQNKKKEQAAYEKGVKEGQSKAK